ncbi:MAG: 2Fe-2S iron-sulfur cluster-binding protein [Bacteroidia bacterium]|nr:2Fe-2S iron-sulfur cluster-binding protein [Bacteroidia bacterium]
MPTVNIDGKSYEFEGRPSLLQWCLDNGIEIPYFCYHPAMSVPTNCRMCLVEAGNHMRNRESGEWEFDEDGKPVIRWGRKPATACNYPMSDGLFVKTHRSSEEIKKAQQGVLEYMLINHPLDCPICDQAGECPLQIWTYKYGPEGSRFEVAKGHKQKQVELGPRVVMDQERCINCTRCTRFTSEISKSNQLSIFGRGEKNYPSTFPGQPFDDAYSMNTIDICPVGALTSKAHRFKARVWEMAHAPGIDMNDSTGTNVFVWIRDNKVMRMTPRHNSEVNDYWMPDAYRLNVDYYNENRLSGAKLKGDIPVSLEDGVKKAAEFLKAEGQNVLLMGSAYESLEVNFALKEFAEKIGVSDVYYLTDIVEGSGDDWLIQEDKTPNAGACELLGFKALSIEEAKGKIEAANLIYSLENGNGLSALKDELSGKTVITHGFHHHEGFDAFDLQLAGALSIEAEGTYINYKGVPQVSALAKQIKRMTPEQWMRLPKSRLDKAAVAVDRWRELDNIVDALPGWHLISMVAQEMGLDMNYQHHKEIFPKVKEKFEVLKDIKVSYKAPKSSFKSTQLEFAPAWGSR